MPTIAALLTVHNRCRLTTACLSVLLEQVLPKGFQLHVYLVDDGSTDGTSEEIRARFPMVNLLQGDGSLFWGGGMRQAWEEASKGMYDYYLWLNDDTTLAHGAIVSLLETFAAVKLAEGKDPIIVGSTLDPETGALSYGGHWLRHPALVEPGSSPVPCDMINGNIVLVSKDVYVQVGTISHEFTHTLGDHDYSLRAVSKGIPVYVGPGNFGFCKEGPPPKWILPETPLRERWCALHTAKGLPPSEYSVFLRHHLPRKRLWQLGKLYLRALFPSFWLRKDHEASAR